MYFEGVGIMKKALLIASVLFIAVISTACINNIAVQELNNKAAEYMQKGDYDSAINRLQASLDLDSTMYETYYNLGIAATNAKKYELAIESLENGKKIKSDFPNFYYSLGVAQAEYADTLVEEETYDSEKQEIVKKEIKDEDKVKAKELKEVAVQNLNKYLEMSPNAEDKATVEQLIKDCQEFDTSDENNQNIVEE